VLACNLLKCSSLQQQSLPAVVDLRSEKTGSQKIVASVSALIFLCMGTIMFWAIYEQQGNTLQLWADEKTNWTFFGLRYSNYLVPIFQPCDDFHVCSTSRSWSGTARAKRGIYI
jgi:dipeptide/tripeptide permease